MKYKLTVRTKDQERKNMERVKEFENQEIALKYLTREIIKYRKEATYKNKDEEEVLGFGVEISATQKYTGEKLIGRIVKIRITSTCFNTEPVYFELKMI